MYLLTLLFGVMLWLGIAVAYVRSNIASTYHPLTFYLFFHGLVFVFRPLLGYYYDYDAIYRLYQFFPSDYIRTKALLVSDLGFVTFALVSARVGRTPIDLHDASHPAASFRTLKNSLLVAIVICTPLGIVSMADHIRTRNSGVNTMVSDAVTGFTVNTTGNGYFDNASILLSTIAVLIAWVWRFKPISFIPFVVVVLAQAATGGRWPFVMATGSLMLFYLLERGKRWPSLPAIGAGLAVCLFFSTVGTDRGESIRMMFTGEKPDHEYEKIKPLEGMDFGNMEFNEYLVSIIPDKTGSYDYFADNLILFTGPIPRAIWKNKPIGSPVQYYSIFDYGSPIGITYSLPGSGWTQFGWLGVIGWCAFGAFLVTWPYERFARGEKTIIRTALYCMALPVTLLFFRDGSIPQELMLGVFSILPILIWFILVKLSQPRNRQALQRPDAAVQKRSIRPGPARLPNGVSNRL